MNDKTPVKVRPEIVQLSAELAKAPKVILTADEERELNDMLNDTVGGVARGDMAGRLKQELSSVVDFIKNINYRKAGKTVEKVAIDEMVILAASTLPFTVFKAICGMLAQKEPIRSARQKIRPETLDNGVLFELYRRDRGTSDKVTTELEQKGYTDEDIEYLLDLTFSIMNANDVISLSGRAAFDDGLASRMGFDRGMDEILAKINSRLEATGFDTKDFKYYWRAHWSVPGINQIAEMVRRGIITEAKAKDLLAYNNLTPEIQESLLKLSYSPLSRLDLRRLFEVGIIDNKMDLIKEYEKIGYTHDNALKLSDLAVKLLARKKIKKGEMRERSTNNILNVYNLTMITKHETKDMLTNIGYNEDEADFLISEADFKNEFDRVQILINAYKKAYLAGMYDDNKIIQLLGHLNLPSKLMDTLLDAWAVEKLHRAERPSKSELLSFYAHGIIDKARCENELKLYGYSSEYILWYMTAAKLPKTETKAVTHAPAS